MPNQYTPRTPLADRLWPRLLHEDIERVLGLGPCWIWQGTKNNQTGYGYLRIRENGKRRNIDIHRLSYELTYGPLPSGFSACHRCDVRLCGRPDHLFAGTHADNLHDMAAKGRSALGDRNGSRTHPERLSRGDQHYTKTDPDAVLRGSARYWRTKLTEADVIKIRRRYAAGGISQSALGREYGLAQTSIRDIILRKTWTHI